jgi:translation initiation factor IF-2
MAKGFLQNHKFVVLLQNIWANKRNNDTLSMEEGKTIRLSAAAREFNVGLQTILDHLAKKGVKIDPSPNSKLSSDVYALLVKEYQKDKAVKQESEKKSFDISHRQSISIDEKKIFVHEEEESVREDFLIKSNMDHDEKPRVKVQAPIPTIAPIATLKPEVTQEIKPVEQVVSAPVAPIVEVQKPEPEKVPVVAATPAPIIEAPKPELVKVPTVSAAPAAETVQPSAPVPTPVPVAEVKKPQETKPVQAPAPAPAPVAIKTPVPTQVAVPVSKPVEEKVIPVQKEVPAQETIKQPVEKSQVEFSAPKPEQHSEKPQAKPHKEAPKAEETDQTDASIKVLGKLDLEAMNFKTKPERKSKEEKKKFREENARTNRPLEAKGSEESKVGSDDNSAEQLGPNNADELADALSRDVSVEQLPNYIRAEVKKLEGPVILGSMKLTETRKPDIKKPVASSVEDAASKAKKKKRKRIKKDADGNPLPQGLQGTNQNSRPIVPMQPLQGGQRGGQPGTGQGGPRGAQQPGQRGSQTPGQPGAQRGPQQPGQPGAPRGAQPGSARGTGKQGAPGKAAANANQQSRPKTSPPGRFPSRDQRKDGPKVELTEEEIQRQIKETLQRLSGAGKSKASKHRREKRHLVHQQMADDQTRLDEEQSTLKVTEFVTANELASMMNVPVVQVISTFMSLGMFVSINQRLDAETLVLVADEFGYKVEFVSVDVQEAISNISDDQDENEEARIPRNPIVTVMGHVDHGKTSLLDYIRSANVIAGEAGGITQHIGAYEVKQENGKKITFLDTPGHEAFTAMRARGAQVTDVAIIVIAADDTIMPQTIEAINHAQAAGVPIVFAINKIDKVNALPEKIKEGLAKMNILVEDWGGKYQSQEISAKKGLNVDKLLEKVLLEAELLELKANPTRLAIGSVIESSLDKGRGYVAKVLVQDGTLRVGDIVLAGSTVGKVKAMYNERNQLVPEAGPSVPVLLLGLNGAPQAGDVFNVMRDERESKNIANRRLQLQREQGLRTQKHITLAEIGRRIAIGDFKELNIIVKGDVDGSVEALSDSMLKLGNQEVQVNVIHKSVGQISESDVMLASASNAIIIGFQVRPSVSARKLAEKEEIDIRLYSIIYTAIDEIKSAIEGMLAPEIEEKITCNIEVREVFNITKVGTIAGCMVLDGKIARNAKIRVIRDGIVVHTGTLGQLKRFKDDVKEVSTGYECGLNINKFDDIKIGDIIEGYEQTEVKRKL